jgi:hypothetical protein
MTLKPPVPLASGLAVFAADDWFLWAVDPAGLVWQFCTELWPEWLPLAPYLDAFLPFWATPAPPPADLDLSEPVVLAMLPFADRYSPEPVMTDLDRHHMTIAEFCSDNECEVPA